MGSRVSFSPVTPTLAVRRLPCSHFCSLPAGKPRTEIECITKRRAEEISHDDHNAFAFASDQANVCLHFRNPTQYNASPDTPSATTFWSESPDGSPQDPLMSGTIQDFQRELGNADPSRPNKSPSTKNGMASQGRNADIAPWASDNSFSTGSFDAREVSSRSGASDFQDPVFRSDDRRPSVISATSVSSQASKNSMPTNSRRAHNKKLAGFFTEDSRESSKSSDTSIATTGQRDHSASSRSRRNNSVHTNNSADGRPISENSSRPRTPPSSAVTPWLFQDFKVCPRVCVCIITFRKFASWLGGPRLLLDCGNV